jgi:uncharacterized protein with HEPN domain
MFSKRTIDRLNDIVENADRIMSYTGDRSLDQFADNQMVVDAVERCLARITEVIIQIGESDVEIARLGVVWVEVKGLGNRLRHEYRRINASIIYETVRSDIPKLRDAAAGALER